jgi:hypothetical protein
MCGQQNIKSAFTAIQTSIQTSCLAINKTSENVFLDYVISGFRRKVDENCTILGYYAARSGNFSQTFRDNISVLSYSLGNNTEERISQSSELTGLQSVMAWTDIVTRKNSPSHKKDKTQLHQADSIRHDLQISVPGKTFFASMCV